MRKFEELELDTLNWADERGLLLNTEDQVRAQLRKVKEEVQEFSDAIDNYYDAVNDMLVSFDTQIAGIHAALKEMRLELGDVFVTLIITAACLNLSPTQTLAEAYGKIKDRKGRLINGIFVKEADLPLEGASDGKN